MIDRLLLQRADAAVMTAADARQLTRSPWRGAWTSALERTPLRHWRLVAGACFPRLASESGYVVWKTSRVTTLVRFVILSVLAVLAVVAAFFGWDYLHYVSYRYFSRGARELLDSRAAKLLMVQIGYWASAPLAMLCCWWTCGEIKRCWMSGKFEENWITPLDRRELLLPLLAPALRPLFWMGMAVPLVPLAFRLANMRSHIDWDFLLGMSVGPWNVIVGAALGMLCGVNVSIRRPRALLALLASGLAAMAWALAPSLPIIAAEWQFEIHYPLIERTGRPHFPAMAMLLFATVAAIVAFGAVAFLLFSALGRAPGLARRLSGRRVRPGVIYLAMCGFGLALSIETALVLPGALEGLSVEGWRHTRAWEWIHLDLAFRPFLWPLAALLAIALLRDMVARLKPY